MADKNIGSLPSASQVDDASLLVMEQQGEAVKATGKQIADFARESASADVQRAVDAANAAEQNAREIASQVTGVEESAAAAQTARTGAEQARQAIEDMLVEAVSLTTGTSATVTKELVDDVVKLVFGLPAGPKGDTGASIQSIERTEGTGAAGTTDTYTVTLTDGSTSTFRVYNGSDGMGAGDMLKSTYDPENRSADVYAYADQKLTAHNADARAHPTKQDKLTGQPGQVVGFDADGKATAQPAPETGVISFKGRSGAVIPQAGDYTAADVGAKPDTWNPEAAGVGYSNAESGMTATNVQGAVDELFTSVSNGKKAVASAITDKGVSTAQDAAFEVMAENIGKIETGVDTSDATAAAGDIASGKTAYAKGVKVTGSIQTTNNGNQHPVAANAVSYSPNISLYMNRSYTEDHLYRAGSSIQMSYPISHFGTATAADVAAGKTFTSAAGLKVTGTLNASNYVTYSGLYTCPNSYSDAFSIPIPSLTIRDTLVSASIIYADAGYRAYSYFLALGLGVTSSTEYKYFLFDSGGGWNQSASSFSVFIMSDALVVTCSNCRFNSGQYFYSATIRKAS